jgi:thiamine-phosphate pyrophosphorylase
MRRKVDWSLYLVTDRPLCLGRPIRRVVEEAVRGGATAVQLREKDCPTREFVEIARELRSLLRPLGVPLLINDRADVALAAGADGLHVGQDDLSVGDARRLLGDDAIIGLSAGTPDEVAAALLLDVDYIGVGPVFATQTKATDRPPWGPEGIARIRPTVRLPLVGIGGINASNAADVIAAGADGVAVVSAVCSASDARAAAQALRRAVEEGRRLSRP